MLQEHPQPPEQDEVPASLLSLADASSSLCRVSTFPAGTPQSSSPHPAVLFSS